MTLHSAADLIAALKPFVGQRRGDHLAGLERLFRHSSHLSSEIRAVRRALPLRRPVPRTRMLERAAALVAAADGSQEENPLPITTHVEEGRETSRLEHATPHQKDRGGLASPLVLFLILILLLIRRGPLSPARSTAAGALASPDIPPQV